MRFRKDINALRGVAVTLVALFHFQTPHFTGGFAGVDVFFVISGYLMTAIVVGRLDAGRFRLRDFYAARFTRIVPALVALCAMLLVFGWFYLDPHGYKLLAKHAGASITFISNFVYWRESGYFDASSQTKWLLHTWSLSVEWQFYLIYPIVLMLGARLFGAKRAVYHGVLGAIGIASFALMPLVVRQHPEANFFLLPTRAWEMVAGGLVMLNEDRFKLNARTATLLQLAGLAAILFAGCGFSESLDWPGVYSLVPVLGAALLIAANANDSLFATNVPLQALGRWSYSIYLWHWPVVVLTHYLDLGTLAVPPALVIVGGLAVSVALGWLSYELVERRAAGIRERFGPRGLGTLATAPVLVIAACAAIGFANGASARLPNQVKVVSAESADVDPRRNECLIDSVYRLDDPKAQIGCRYGASPKLGAIVWGDSHGNAVMPSVAATAAQNNQSVMFYGTSGCPPFEGASRFGKHTEEPCRRFASRVADDLRRYPSSVPLLVVARFSAYVDGKNIDNDPTILIGYNGARPSGDPAERRTLYASFLTHDLCALAQTRPTYVLLPIPEMDRNVPDYLSRLLILGRHPDDVSISEAEYTQRNATAHAAIEQAAQQCGVKVLDPTPYLCRDGRCYGSESMVPLYIDGDHLSRRGSDRLAPLFREVFNQAS
ncbi:acyltransferase family protein [Pararobbsia silviterrae]|uniref:Acyltransferase n=1 Tax=Pararobbsia silviterrae TaxID=1792498 RepID=A0A494Y926_9BURK|nr:acyltransferase family protein [Pararobbsia silviterrae]RKP59141.1 acyltransferase [Pararobbsia silviterrae]